MSLTSSWRLSGAPRRAAPGALRETASALALYDPRNTLRADYNIPPAG
ncbi:hypothetical protein [Streptosporangium roseum]|nr:hypothetical protein [Streptosporangium roseum]